MNGSLSQAFTQKSNISSLSVLPKAVRDYVEAKAKICQPDRIQVCDGTEAENNLILRQLEAEGVIRPLKKLKNRYLLTKKRNCSR